MTEAESYARLVIRMEAGALRLVDSSDVEGPLVQPSTVVPGLAHELLIDGRRVSLGSLPDVSISRSFSEIGPDRPREHHIYKLPAFDFVVRVPHAELRGVDPSKIAVNLVSVQERHSHSLTAAMPMSQDPALDVTTIASLNNLSLAELPASMQRVIKST